MILSLLDGGDVKVYLLHFYISPNTKTKKQKK